MASQQQRPPSPSPSLPTSTSPILPSKPQPLNIQNNNLMPSQSSPRRGSIAAHLMNFAVRSTTSLHLLSSSAPAHSSLSDESRLQLAPSRGFSNPFKKLQSTFHSTKKNPDPIKSERIISSSSSVNSLVSWRSRGAEMLSKKAWGRARKNSEPTFGAKGLPTTPVFGASLEDAVRMSHIPSTPMVPAVLYRCVEYLEAKGIDEVGLYRVPGSHASVQKLKKMFDSGKDHKLLTMDGIDPNDIATLLKLYLRELPSPLFPAVFLEQFQSVISTDRQVCHSLRGILVRLPRTNYVVLSFLCHHLSKIAAYSEKTKMNVSNLAVVFAPTLSIGSVLFRALLGGYYDTPDSFENREQGLKIVWGGLSQDFDYTQDEWEEGPLNRLSRAPLGSLPYQSSPQLPLTPAQELVHATTLAKAEAVLPPAPLAPAAISVTPIAPTVPVVSTTPATPATPDAPTQVLSPVRLYASEDALIEQPLPSTTEVPAQTQIAQTKPCTAEDEENQLMAAMLLREELAAKNRKDDDDDESTSDAASSTSSIPCTDTTALSAVSSPGLNAKEQVSEASFASPSMAFSPIMATSIPGKHHVPSSMSAPSSAIPLIGHTTSSLSMQLATTTTATATSSYPAPSTVNVTIDSESLDPMAGAAPASEATSSGLFTAGDKEELSIDSDIPLATVSVTPQLPPLEGLMIAL